MKLNQDQALSLARSALKIIGAALISHGATKAGAIVNSEDVLGLVMTLIGLAFSNKSHADPTPPPDEPKTT